MIWSEAEAAAANISGRRPFPFEYVLTHLRSVQVATGYLGQSQTGQVLTWFHSHARDHSVTSSVANARSSSPQFNTTRTSRGPSGSPCFTIRNRESSPEMS